MGILINPPVQLDLVSGCEARRDAVALGTVSVVVGLVRSLVACSCTLASTGLAAIAHIQLHWVWLLVVRLVGGISKAFSDLKMETAQRTVRFRAASAAIISKGL